MLGKVLARLDVRHGRPPVDAQPFKKQVVALCLQQTSNQMLRSIYAQCLPNGDWNNHSAVEIWVPVGTEVQKEAVGRMVGVAIVNVFASHLFSIYQRAKMKCAVALPSRIA